MRELPWFRFYSDAYTDTKFQRIARDMSMDTITVIGAWVVVLCLAARSPVRGALFITENEPYTWQDLAEILGWDETAMERFMKRCETMGMYEGETHTITNWHKRQYSSDVSTERVAKYREKQGAVAEEKREGNVSETAPETDTDTETENILSNGGGKNIFTLYSENIGELTQITALELKDLADDYTDAWVADAIRIAVMNNARNLHYIKAVLNNRRNGRTSKQAKQAKDRRDTPEAIRKYGEWEKK